MTDNQIAIQRQLHLFLFVCLRCGMITELLDAVKDACE